MPTPTPSPLPPSLLTAVADAIAKADGHRHYGSYDYSSYKGEDAPYVIRDEDARKEVYRGWDSDYCHALYEKLTREWIAQKAIEAMEAWLAADVANRLAEFNKGALWGRRP